MNEKAYIIREQVVATSSYNPAFGDGRVCKCGHQYHRHFDSYEDMSPIACKYCVCELFVEREAKK